ncbi:MAG: hypothetical protein AABZ34_19050 [Nitrospirota bacterium]
MRVPISEIDTTPGGTAKAKRIGWFVQDENGQVAQDPPGNQILMSIRQINVITTDGKQQIIYTCEDHPAEWLVHLHTTLRGYIFAGRAELTPEERKRVPRASGDEPSAGESR